MTISTQKQQSEKALCEPENEESFFSYDPDWIQFRKWTAVLHLAGELSEEVRPNRSILFVSEDWEESYIPTLTAGTPVGLKNVRQWPQLSLALVARETGKEVFFARTLPPHRMLNLDILKEGLYTLHYFPKFGGMYLHRTLRVVAPKSKRQTIPPNFHPHLKPDWYV